MSSPQAIRMVVVWCPDWPVVAWGIPLDEPAAVVVANRVVATSPAARDEGVEVGQRRRDAQGRCPDVAILERDIDRESRLFEPVAAALEAITPEVEVAGAGLVGFPTKGPSRFFGGDQALAEQVGLVVQPVLAGRGDARIGIADGVFAARLAARSARAARGHVVIEPGQSPEFLAGFGIGTLGLPHLSDVLVRLGLRTLGSFAALNAADVSGRFGQEGLLAHRLARGEDQHPPDLRRPAHDLAVTWAFEPAAERIDQCAFAAKRWPTTSMPRSTPKGWRVFGLVSRLRPKRESGTIVCGATRALSAAALADRARWQLDGWLNAGAGGRPSAGVARLTLLPDEVVPATGRQLGFWGGRADRADDVTRVVARIQAMLGPESVSVPEWRGGRGPGEQIGLIPAAAVDLGEARPATDASWVTQPWPGQIPRPAPAKVFDDPAPIQFVGPSGNAVTVTGRGDMSEPPGMVQFGRGRWLRVVSWAGPWPADERWWDPLTHRRRARMQVVCEDGSAHLVSIEGQTWWLEATYT
ncbi:MAG: hypothetical protein R2706_01235 [Acidimicrobiales bacterium]